MRVIPVACSFCGKKNHNVRTCKKLVQHTKLQEEMTPWLTEVAKELITKTGFHRGVFCQIEKRIEEKPINGIIIDIAWKNFCANSIFEFNWKRYNSWFFPYTFYCVKVLDQKTLETSFFHMTQVNQVREYLNERFAEVNHEESLIKLNYTTGARAKLYTDTINIYQMDNQKAAQEEIERLSDINKIVLSGEYPSNLHHSYNRSYTKFYTHVHQYLKDHFKKTS
jgi:hypothetical protein